MLGIDGAPLPPDMLRRSGPVKEELDEPAKDHDMHGLNPVQAPAPTSSVVFDPAEADTLVVNPFSPSLTPSPRPKVSVEMDFPATQASPVHGSPVPATKAYQVPETPIPATQASPVLGTPVPATQPSPKLLQTPITATEAEKATPATVPSSPPPARAASDAELTELDAEIARMECLGSVL